MACVRSRIVNIKTCRTNAEGVTGFHVFLLIRNCPESFEFILIQGLAIMQSIFYSLLLQLHYLIF